MTDAVKPLAFAEIVSEMRSLAEMNLHLNAEASRDLLTQLANKLERCTPPAGWKPIETAPRDGTEFVAWRPDSGIFMVRWTYPAAFLTDPEQEGLSEDDLFAEGWFYADFIAGDRLETDPPFNYWMLPAAPENDDEQT